MEDPTLRARDESPAPRPRIGVFIVAYNASSTIQKVLSRIPDPLWEQIDEVFVFDDSSQDDTTRAALEFAREERREKVKVYFNEVNLGYGGNQKRGYLYALQKKFDLVVLLHGDGQYAPECLGAMLQPLVDGEADAVFGSRMMERGGALRGGMPLYKFVGNKILSTFQNRVLGQSLSEYHSGYRAYRVSALGTVPFQRNSNDFHFDTEIILQFLEAGHRIFEIPIPTFYGDEICRVNGMRYAWNVFVATLGYRLHKLGLGYRPQYDIAAAKKYAYKQNPHSSHNRILRMVEERRAITDREALDIGCGTGFLAARVAEMGYRVVGIDRYDNDEARRACRKFLVCDIEKGIPLPEGEMYDCILLSDVLERVREPEELLLWARRRLRDGGRIIASTGNVAHLLPRLGLLIGLFTYTERGILDRSLVRHFTLGAFRSLFRDCSFRVTAEAYCPIPFERIFTRWTRLSDLLSAVNLFLCRLWASLFAYQIVIEARIDHQSVGERLRKSQIHAPYEPRDTGQDVAGQGA